MQRQRHIGTDKDKYKVFPRVNVCYIFERQRVQWYQIWHFLQKFPPKIFHFNFLFPKKLFHQKKNFHPTFSTKLFQLKLIFHQSEYLSFAQFTWSSSIFKLIWYGAQDNGMSTSWLCFLPVFKNKTHSIWFATIKFISILFMKQR